MSAGFIRNLDFFLRKIMVKFSITISFIVCLYFYFLNNKDLQLFVNYLKRGDDSINTMASIFTGIYFSLCTLMLSLPSFSKIKQLGKKNYYSLLKILLFGLIWSLAYSLWQIVLAFSSNEILMIVNFILMLGFILSVVQTTLYFSIILSQDLMNSYDADDEVSQDIQTIKRMIEEMERREKLKENDKESA